MTKEVNYMKRITLLTLCCILLLTLLGCSSNQPSLSSGYHFADGDYNQFSRPFLYLDTESDTFILGAGFGLPYGERGSYVIKDGNLIAESEERTLTFEIQDAQTLILKDSAHNEYLQLNESSVFVFSEEIL